MCCAVLLLSPLLCFYFASYFASTLLLLCFLPSSDLTFERADLILKLVFEGTKLVSESSILGASWWSLSVVVVFCRGGHALTTRNSGPAFLPPSSPLQNTHKVYPTRLQKMQLFHLVMQRSHKGTFCRPAKSPLNGCFCIAI